MNAREKKATDDKDEELKSIKSLIAKLHTEEERIETKINQTKFLVETNNKNIASNSGLLVKENTIKVI